MPRDRVLALIQAGGAGSRMDVLTRERAKPTLPFAGSYQLVDFPLSNLAHAGVDEVWLSVAYQGSTVEEDVANGRPWDLDRTRSGLRLVLPQPGSGSTDQDGFAQGNADELYRLRDRIRACDPTVVLTMSADHVYRFDYADALATHRESEAECTAVVSRRPLEEVGDHATIEHDESGTVTAFAYKPEHPTTTTVATEIFCYRPDVLIEVLEQLHHELGAEAPEGDSGLGDYGEHLLPRMVARGRTVVHRMSGYWRDVGTPLKYVQAHRELLDGVVDVFDDPAWPILGRSPQQPPAYVAEEARLANSMLSPGCRIAGEVVRSVLGPGVVVEAGAEVSDSVLFGGTRVGAGAVVRWTVLDKDCIVGPHARVGGAPASPDDADRLTLVGRGSRVRPHAEILAGSRLEPGSDA